MKEGYIYILILIGKVLSKSIKGPDTHTHTHKTSLNGSRNYGSGGGSGDRSIPAATLSSPIFLLLAYGTYMESS